MSKTTNYEFVKPDDSTRIGDFPELNADNLDAIDAVLKDQADDIALLTPIKVTNASPSFASDNTYQDYGYKGTITVTGATASMRPEVIFGFAEAMSGNYAPICESGAGVVYIYAKVNTPITVPLVVVHKE